MVIFEFSRPDQVSSAVIDKEFNKGRAQDVENQRKGEYKKPIGFCHCSHSSLFTLSKMTADKSRIISCL